MSVILIIIVFIFYLNIFLFKIQTELFYKIIYIIGVWVCLGLLNYMYIEDFLYYLSQFLNEYLIVKDFQDIITIYIQITFLLATLLTCFYFLVIYNVWNQVINYRSKNKNYEFFLIIYLIGIVFWIVKQDLFFSNWEIFLISTKQLFFDIQPDFYIFFQNLIDDLNDFFIITSLFYFFYYLFFNKKNILKINKVFHFRYLFFCFFLLYFIYFFSCELWYNFFYFNIISLFLIELLLYTRFFLIELKKLIIKSKYF